MKCFYLGFYLLKKLVVFFNLKYLKIEESTPDFIYCR